MGLGVYGRKPDCYSYTWGHEGFKTFVFSCFFFRPLFRSSLRLILHRLANKPQLAECSAGRVTLSGRNQTSEHTVGDNQHQMQCQKSLRLLNGF